MTGQQKIDPMTGRSYKFDRDQPPIEQFPQTPQTIVNSAAANRKSTNSKNWVPITVDWNIWYPRWREIMVSIYGE